MKISKRDLKLLLVLAGLLIFLALYFGAFLPLQSKTETINESISQLQPELDQLEDRFLNLAVYEDGITAYRDSVNDKLDHYPSNIENPDFLVYLLNMEKKVGFTMTGASFEEPGLLLQFPCEVPVDGQAAVTNVSAYRTGVIMTGEVTYPQMKQTIDYLYASDERTALDSLSASYNAETGKITASFSVAKYFIDWEGAKYNTARLPITQQGTADLFGTT